MNLTQTISHPQMPNIVTLSRLVAAFLIVIWMTLKPDGSFGVSVGTALIYLAAALTDLLDGYLARKFNLVSFLGVFLDPLADKLLVSAALIMLIPLGRVLAWVVFLILAREIAITGLRAIAAERGLVISASESGKRKTLAQNIALFCLLWHYPLFWADTAGVGTVIIYVALVITYWSGFRYFYDFYQTSR
ncbi:MAG: CDP-diacylglycerol--glycerol-3-phosphate 3-phosphatidyltransferase [Candidatus Adiutrix intracellularis]|jgi:CDP-diacylglycerol--glycerol-3-phosphate 3-phosphatidyltransferase|nr:CDP-diacylglycerol--glycerol-3-phosphate 3-phosphatidyltransferase [Candidatus Adiutrix intracellularis]